MDITAANRLLRLYDSTTTPSENLVIFVTYILKVYALLWFLIKGNSSCKSGALHVWQTIHNSRYFSVDLRAVVDPVIQCNGYFRHPENILLCMLSDERKHIRELAMRHILRARSEQYGLRLFMILKLNFEAKEKIDLINWQQTPISEPPIFVNNSADDIEMFVASGDTPLMDFPKYSCHTQAVERCVKLVTELSSSVCGVKARDGFIRVRFEFRKIMPILRSKCDYRTAL